MATAMKATPSTAMVPSSLTNEQLLAVLGQAGMLNAGGGDTQYHRMSLKGGSLKTDEGQPNEETWPPAKNGPTMTVRIVKPPVYYNSFFCDETEKNRSVDARRVGRPDLNGRFVKKYDDPEEQRADEWANVDVYDDLCALTKSRGQFKADIQVQIMPEDGNFTGEEPVYTLTLSTTSALDWRGSSKNPSAGIVQDENFIVQLAQLAKAAAEGIEDETKKILDAMTVLRMGGVIAEVYLVQAKSETDASIVWTVIAFKPIHIEWDYLSDGPALEAGEQTLTANSDDIPF